MLQAYEPFIVYQNVLKFAEYRSLRVTSRGEGDDELSFAKHMRNNNYHLVVCEEASRVISILILEPGSNYVKKSAEFGKLLDKYGTKSSELIVITKEEPNTHFFNKIKKFTEEMEGSCKVYTYLYRVFLYDFSKSVHCKYIRLTPEQQEQVKEDFLVTASNFPKARSNDPDVIWLGAKKGEIVKIHRISENTAEAVAYREVV